MKQLTLLVSLALLTACAEGTDVSLAGAPRYFETNRAELERIVNLVDACRPARPNSSFSRVFAERSRANRGLYCQRPGIEVEEIVQALRQAGLVAADYVVGAPDSANAPLTGADITIYSEGLSVSGRSISFRYFVDESAGLEQLQRQEPEFVETRPLTPAPHHWLWEQVR